MTVAVAALSLALAQSAIADVITPNTLTDEYNATPATCSLREAVEATNTDTVFSGCPTGNGADEIQLGDGTYQLSRGEATNSNADGELDVTAGDTLTISHAGAGRTAIDGGDLDRVITSNGTLTITGLAVQNGSVAGNGGGIFTDGTLTMTNAAVTENDITTGYAGGISAFSGTVTLTNTTVSGNRAGTVSGGGAGGIYLGGTLNVNNATIANNNGNAGSGGGVSMGGASTMNMKNTIIAGNSTSVGSPDCYHPGGTTLNSLGYNLMGSTLGCGYALGTGDQIDVQAGLAALVDNGGPTSTQAVTPGSNAQDKVPPANCTPLTADQRGYPRPSANSVNCDEGAYELTTCDGSPLNVPGAFPGCPSPPPAGGGGSSATPPPPAFVPLSPVTRKRCKKAKKGAVSAKKCRRKR